MNHNKPLNLLPLTFEVIVDGITIFVAFLVRDTLVSILNEIAPNRESTIYTNIIYTLLTIIVCTIFICIVRRYITHDKNQKPHTPTPSSYNLFD